ncbi:hypothetical protein B0H99_10880 [Planomicrobium soli]|uniref:Lipoprotein n=1 Tax=Planomicrobium soli TaxID=1176648 RepID=A0A2P8GMH8_9BACL|nr:hypothetical protein [Planomicrobium soli]PSL35177.1 hypothetical protein B0H99_10880 [Planomicrobium soli]
MKIKTKLFLFLFVFLLASCGIGQETKEEDNRTAEKVSAKTAEEAPSAESEFSAADPGEWQKSSNGEFRLASYGLNEEIALDFSETPFIPVEMGAMNVSVQDVSVIDYKPGEAQKRVVFGDTDIVRVISAYMVINNYSDMDILFDPDEASLLTNTGETLHPLKHWTWTIDGNFTAGATKAVSIAWALEDTESELTSVRIAFAPPVSKTTNEELSGPLEIEIEIVPY